MKIVNPTNYKFRFGMQTKLLAIILLLTTTNIGIVAFSLYTVSRQKADAVIVNISGRQRMLTQKMSKEVLAIFSNINPEKNLKALKGTYDLFGRSHDGLINGNEKMKLPPTDDKKVLTQMMVVDGLWKKFSPNIVKVLDNKDSSQNNQEAVNEVLTTNLPLLKDMNKAVGMYEQASKNKVGFLEKVLLVGGILTLLITGLCWIIISRIIVVPIGKSVQMINEMSKGHLDQRLKIESKDEIGVMARAMDSFADDLQSGTVDLLQKLAEGDLTFDAKPKDESDVIGTALMHTGKSLNDLVARISVAVEQVALGSQQISQSSQTLSLGAGEQAKTVDAISSTINQLSAGTKANAENATQANQLAIQNRKKAETGKNQMAEMLVAMEKISESSKDISKVIKVIDDIAFQTNLLALNAAVEAARAGKYGKGFAVVSEEVRNLAARSGKAARETADLIESSVERVQTGTKIADMTSEVLSDIVASTNQVTDLVGEISSASNEQAQGVEQLSQGMEKISRVIRDNSSQSENMAASAEELSSQAAHSRQMLSRFRLKENEFRGQFVAGEEMKGLTAAPSSDNEEEDLLELTHRSELVTEPMEKIISLDDTEFDRY